MWERCILVLSDVEIREALAQGSIKVFPTPIDRDIQPASIDVHLGSRFGQLVSNDGAPRRLTAPSDVKYIDIGDKGEYVLYPGEFVIGHLLETVAIDASLVARIEGKSSNGRRGVAIHVTAGFVDPGWDGVLTVELYNASNITYSLCKGDPIGQLAFDRLVVPSARPYGHKDLGSHYQNSISVGGAL